MISLLATCSCVTFLVYLHDSVCRMDTVLVNAIVVTFGGLVIGDTEANVHLYAGHFVEIYCPDDSSLWKNISLFITSLYFP